MKRTKLFGLALTVTLALTACGGSGGGSGDAAAPADQNTAKPAGTWASADPALAEELKAAGFTGEIKGATDLTIGMPWAVEENGKPAGLDIDLAEALGDVLGTRIDLQNTSFDSLIPGLAAGRYDVTISAMLDNKKRQEQVDFVDFIIDSSGFVVPTDSDIEDLTLETSCGRTIGVVRGSAEEMYLSEQSTKCEQEGKPAVKLQVFQQLQQGMLAVTSGRIEALCGDSLQNAYLEAKPDSKIKQVGKPINEAPVGMALPKGSKLVPVLQKALQKLVDDGAYIKILEKYGVAHGALTKITVNDARS
ncbi:ABC transporter substrate-binding protein [Nonomuraea sp. MCN248]|uniref:ABC transporter substrate-binding protein n=1 Tax=Nonomuraea corallina TaxID=2989783 RepID=A0ABT4SG14_9ACTN|nr:ABC transporter substrate-binding protein [Nonomuraea corallina]MDA0636085.1 ABC transporter substrate-binding protein [Nonomuraea corallina]